MEPRNSKFLHNLDISPGGERNLPKKILIYSVIALSIVLLITLVYLFIKSLGNDEGTVIDNKNGDNDNFYSDSMGNASETKDSQETYGDDGDNGDGDSEDSPGEGLFEFFEFSN